MKTLTCVTHAFKQLRIMFTEQCSSTMQTAS